MRFESGGHHQKYEPEVEIGLSELYEIFDVRVSGNSGREFGFESWGLRAFKIVLVAFGPKRLDPKFHEILRVPGPSPISTSDMDQFD